MKMKVYELIKKLEEMNPDQIVLIDAEVKTAHLDYCDVPLIDVWQTAHFVTLFAAED